MEQATVNASNTFKKKYAYHPKFKQAFDAVERLLVNRDEENSCLFVVGQPGVGKSFFTKQLLARKGAERSDRDCRFAIRGEVGFERGITGLIEDLLYELGDTAPETGGLPSKRRRLFRLLKQLEVELIIIDEIHGILPRSGLTAHSPAVKLLKSLLNNTRSSLLLCGKESALTLRTDPELDDRCDADVRLKPFTCFGAEERFEFIAYLLDLLRDFPCKVKYLDCVYKTRQGNKMVMLDISEYNNLHRFLAATKGSPRRIRRLFCGALELAGVGNDITKVELSQVWEERLKSRENEANPFTKGYAQLTDKLVKEKMYA